MRLGDENFAVRPVKHPALRADPAFKGEPLRLLKAVTIFAPGGTEKQVHNLVRHLDHARFDLQFACLRKFGYFLKEVEDWGIPVEEFPISSLYKPSTFLEQLRFARFLRAQRIQVMHSYNFYSNAFAVPAARMAGVPVVVASIRDQGFNMSPLQIRLQKWTTRLAHRILVNAASIRDWLIADGYDPAAITLIRNGIDLAKFQRRPGYKSVREEYGVAPQAPLVVMLARLVPKKGVDDFLRAAAILAQRFPSARFLLVGERLTVTNGKCAPDQAYHEELRMLCRDLGLDDKVIFTGHRHDVPELLMQSNVSVLPSHTEGLSNSLLESMAAGLPLVATDVGGNPELVREGENGFLVPVQDPEALAQAIGRILADENLARRFGRASKQRAQEEFSMERMVRDTQQVYLEEWERRGPAGALRAAGARR